MTEPTTIDIDALVRVNGATPSEPESRIVRLTPTTAAEWYGRNTHNRTLRDEYVEELTQAILRGEWRLNGDPIRFSTDLVLLDGQHRLAALVKAGKVDPDVYIDTFVIFNLPPETQETMDGGRKRMLADLLHMRGEKHTTVLAATLTKLFLWRQGEAALRNPQMRRPTFTQSLALLEAEPHVRDAILVAGRLRRQLEHSVPHSLIASCLYTFHNISPEDSREFWRQVASGENLTKTDPTYKLRQMYVRNGSRRRKSPSMLLHALTIKAWNAFREGRQIETLHWKMGGANPDKFPEPV